MKLFQIWNAVPAFQTLTALKKNPKLAYSLLKYMKQIESEVAVCEQHRQDCVYEVSGAARGTPVQIEKGTPQWDEFNAKFQEFMRTDSDLEAFDLAMGDLIDALGAETGNVISEDELELLEPFFN